MSESLNLISAKKDVKSFTGSYTDSYVPSKTISVKRFKTIMKTPSRKKKKLPGLKAQEVRDLLDNDIISFCQKHCLIASSVLCYCGNQMVLSHQYKSLDPVIWTCTERVDHTTTLSIRTGTWFENSILPLFDILWLSYLWVYEYSDVSMLHECDNTPETVDLWNRSCSDACRNILESKCDKVGGTGKWVEIIECKFFPEKKTLNKQEQEKNNEQWVFCAVEQESTKCVLIVIDDMKSDSIVEIFEKYILPGTLIYSNTWCSYRNLKGEHFTYLTSQRSVTFFDTVLESNIETVQDFLEISCSPNRWIKYEYNSHFWELMYRKSLAFAQDAFFQFLKDISNIYSPHDKIDNDTSLKS